MTPECRRAGIIAAGQGSRLAGSHPGCAKPLVPVAGRPLCHWVAASLREAGITDITLLHNSDGCGVRRSLEEAFGDIAWTFLQADTASSWESFRLVARTIAQTQAPFLISTVDALVPPAETKRFWDFAATRDAAASLALTAFVDDEKPLWAQIDDSGRVTALGEPCSDRRYVTSGLYYLSAATAQGLPEPRAFPSLRRYLTALVDSGALVTGHPLAKTIDVDRPEDVVQAEGFLKEAISSW
ncbi:MAG: NTP transferase domain-containing protein [Elusimicrobia bacterium]|nr:NTP transferase domain-containing protein [Elusimicrobiota bacterium]MDE2237670.1 NTP transferase domain-containing protein [Elusimicrobiota bacterium]MDE2424356.1 NTP transferase domain-containing protein [Elusimicrobiota bacterium]